MMVHALVKQIPVLTESIEEYDRRSLRCSKHMTIRLCLAASLAQARRWPRGCWRCFGSDRSRFEFAAEVQQLSGVAPVTEKSGKACWVHWRFACSKFLRQSFHEFAGQSILKSVWARAYYQQQRQRGTSHHAALRALAYKWIRIIFRCWKDRTPYDEAKYCQSLKLRGSNLASHLEAVSN